MSTLEIGHVVRTAIAERDLEARLARGHAADVRALEADLMLQLAHTPPAAVQSAIAEEVLRLQERRREVWLRAAGRLPAVQRDVGDVVESTADANVASTMEREEHSVQGVTVRRIVVAVDGSDSSLRAVDVAVRLCEREGAELDLIAVVDDPTASSMVGATMARAGFHEDARAEALRRGLLRVPSPGPVVHERMLHGQAVTAILHEANEPGVVFIVVGRRADGTTTHAGSVSQAVAAHAPVPILVVP